MAAHEGAQVAGVGRSPGGRVRWWDVEHFGACLAVPGILRGEHVGDGGRLLAGPLTSADDAGDEHRAEETRDDQRRPVAGEQSPFMADDADKHVQPRLDVGYTRTREVAQAAPHAAARTHAASSASATFTPRSAHAVSGSE